jgi:hypothetical protein
MLGKMPEYTSPKENSQEWVYSKLLQIQVRTGLHENTRKLIMPILDQSNFCWVFCKYKGKADKSDGCNKGAEKDYYFRS